MTWVPYNLNRHRTSSEFALVPEDNSFRYELQEGIITVRPRPANLHMKLLLRIGAHIDGQLPSNLDVLSEVKVDLGLSAPFVRVPDLVVLPSNLDHQSPNRAADILLAVEILSPESIRLDTKTKLIEYADAGIPNFWIVDPTPPVTATIYRLSEHGYEESQRAEHTFTVEEPCPLTIDLDALLPAG